MSEGFASDILGGEETLIRKGIQSADYVPGVSGWRIGKDGSFEAANATIRGLVFSAIQATSANGGDAVITAAIDGDTFSRLQILANGDLKFGPGNAVQDLGIGRNDDGAFQVDGHATVTGGFDVGFTAVFNGAATFNDTVTMNDVEIANGNLTVDSTAKGADLILQNGAALLIDSQGDIEINGVSQPLGLQQYNPVNMSPTRTFSTVEAVIAALPSFTFKRQRVYEIRVRAAISDATTPQVMLLKCKKGTTTAGAQFTASGNLPFPLVSAIGWDIRMTVGNYSGADITTTWCVTGVTSSGTATVSNLSDGSGRTHFDIYDIGHVNDFTNEPPIT